MSVRAGLLSAAAAAALACASGPSPEAPAAAPPEPAPAPAEPPAPPEAPPPEPRPPEALPPEAVPPEAMPSGPVRGARPPPEGWVELAAHVPGLRLGIGYATPDNFVGSVLPGYGVPGAWLRRGAADGLRCAQEKVAARGFGLRVRDAYRPLRATRAMVAWAHRTGQVHLLDDGYVSRYSGHNRGDTIDLELARPDGGPVDHGTPWDTLSEASHTRNATGEALANRQVLVDAMTACGFRNYWKEWWHFTYQEPGEKELPHRDVPYACAEPAEGAWVEPKDWRTPGWAPPPPPPPTDCP